MRFDPEDRERPIRIWDAIDGDLVKRTSSDPELHACEALGLFWIVVEDPLIGPMLRLSRDREGRDRLPTPDEAEVAVREAHQELKAEVEMLRAELEKAKGERRTR